MRSFLKRGLAFLLSLFLVAGLLTVGLPAPAAHAANSNGAFTLDVTRSDEPEGEEEHHYYYSYTDGTNPKKIDGNAQTSLFYHGVEIKNIADYFTADDTQTISFAGVSAPSVTSASLCYGLTQTVTFSLPGMPDGFAYDGTQRIWAVTAGANLVTVSSSGKVDLTGDAALGKADGSATVTMTCGGIVQEYGINVTKPSVDSVTIDVATATNGAINAGTLSGAGNVVATVTVTGANLSAGLITVTPTGAGLSAGTVTVNAAHTVATCPVSFSGSDDAATNFSVAVDAFGTEDSASFKIDNVVPTGSFAVSFDGSGTATVDTSGIQNCDSLFTAGVHIDGLTGYLYSQSSFTESASGSDTLYLRAWDLHQNAMYVSVPITECTLADQSPPSGLQDADGNIYYNAAIQGNMALPLTCSGATPSVDGFAVTTIDAAEGKYAVGWGSATSGSIGSDFSGSFSYSGYGYSATAPITNNLSRSYVLDTTVPTITATADKGVFYHVGTAPYLGVPSPYKQGTDTITLTTEDNEGGSGLGSGDLADNDKSIGVSVSVTESDVAVTQTINISSYGVTDRAGNANVGWNLYNPKTNTTLESVTGNLIASPIVPAWPSDLSPAAGDTWYSADIDASFTVNQGKDYSDDTVIEPSSVAVSFNGSSVTPSGSGSGTWTATLPVDGIEAANVELKITVTSVSDHVQEAMTTELSSTLNVDAVAPRVSADIDGTPVADNYFNDPRTLNIKVEDLNSFSGVLEYTVDGVGKTANFSSSRWSITFENGGAYVITGLTLTDSCGNATTLSDFTITGYNATDFIIDNTPPVVEVSFDNNTAVNDIYFSADRTATVTVTEVNFDPTLVDFGSTTGTLPTSWTDNGDVHTATVVFDTEAEHSFAVSVTDKANNPNDGVDYGSSVAPEAFVIDKTAPTVTLALDQNDAVRNDKYFSVDSRTLTITVADVNMETDAGCEVTFLEGSETFGTSGLTHAFSGDGTYGVRTVTATDLAGNVTSITFTANDTAPTVDPADKVTIGDAVAPYEFILDTTAPTMTVSLTSMTDGSDSQLDDIVIFQKLTEDGFDPGEGKYYLVFNEDNDAVNDDNQFTLEVTLDLDIYDLNLLTPSGDPDSEFIPATVTAYCLKESETEAGVFSYVTEAVVLQSAIDAANGTISYSGSVTVKPNEACYLVYSVKVIDLAGNLITDADVTEQTNSDYSFDAIVGEDGTVTNTFAFDRRQPGTAVDDTGVPTSECVRDVTPVVDHLYSEDVTYTVEINDGAEESDYDDGNSYHNYQNVGLKSVEVIVENGGKGEGEVTIAADKRSASGSITVSPDNEVGEANDIEVTIKAIDRAGNKIIRKDTISIDKAAPRVTYSITGASARNNEYYNAARTATITIEDANFSSGYVTVNGKATALKVGDNTVAFNGPDTDYTVAIHTEDLITTNTTDSALKTAHTTDTNNVTTQGENPWKFTVDTVAPVLTVVFDNNNARNGNYYKAARTAMATITERNFDQNDVVFENMGAACGLTGWTAADPHTSTVPCKTDGKYHFSISFQDLAGNQAQAYDSNVFYIDLTAPVVEITNIKPFSANRNEVMPIVSFHDDNFDPNGYTIVTTKKTLAGGSSPVTLNSTKSQLSDGVQIDFADLPSTLENDGIYTITATIIDMAGNEASTSVTYSVNRKGSTYAAYGAETEALLSGVYSNTAPTVMISEINPDFLESYSVTITVNSKSIKLKEGSDFTVAYSGGNDEFKSYIYTINSSVFQQDGALIEGDYSIFLDSVDKAGNNNSNRANQNACAINFTLDSSAPVLSITGVSEKARIKEAAREVTVFFEDATALTKLEVYVNGQLVQTIEGDALAALGGSHSFKIDESNSDQSLEIRATDSAGNVAVSKVESFYINSSGLRQFVHNTPVFVGSLVGVAALAGVAAYLISRKKKAKADASAAAEAK